MYYEGKLWKKVTYPGVRKDFYLISEDGQLLNAITMKKLSPYEHGGYFRYNIAADGRSSRGYSVFAHRLVAWEFVPNSENFPIVDHIDGNKANTHYSNLEWVTYRENNLRARKLGSIHDQGYLHTSSIFSEELARSICEQFERGMSIKEVFRWVCKNPKAKPNDDLPLYQFIHRLKHHSGWDNITCDYCYPSHDEKRTGKWEKEAPGTGNYKYTEEQIRLVCKYLEDGKSAQDILEIFTGSRYQRDNKKIYDFIDGIRRKKTWTEISCEYNIDNNSTRKRNTSCDPIIADWVDKGLSKKEIRNKLFEIDPSFDKNAAARVNRMIDRYIQFKNISSESIFYISDENESEI